jgi:diguanylate cyclase (GGDEF)-like protein
MVREPAGSADLGVAARTLRAAALVALVGYLGALLLGPDGHQLWREWAFQGLVLALITAFSVVVTVRSPSDRLLRGAISGWMGLFAVGNLVQNAHRGDQITGWQNIVSVVLFLSCYPVAIGAVLLSHRGRWQFRSAGAVLDALVPALTVAAMFMAAILPPAARVLAERGPAVLYVIVMPVLDVTAAMLLVVTLAFTGRLPERVSGWLFLGMTLFASGDSRWAIATAEGTWRTGTSLDAVWVLGCAAVGLGATGAPGRVHHRVMGVATLAVPLIGAVTSLALVLVGTQVRLAVTALGLAAAAILAALLRLVHAYGQVLTLEETRHQARTDVLTGLGNRRGLQEAVGRAVGAVQFRPFAVVLADLDGFKQVNDEHGHAVGDELLQTVAERLLRALPDGSVLTRLGGDEFAAVIPLEAADLAADPRSSDWPARLTAAVRAAGEQVGAEWLHGGVRFTVGASFGVAVSLDRTEGLAALLHRADVAMYRAKRSGGPGSSRVHVHRPEDGLGAGTRAGRRPPLQAGSPVG